MRLCLAKFRSNALFIGEGTRKAVQEGRADYTPCFLSEIPKLFLEGVLPLNTALVQVSHDPPRYERRLRDGSVEVFTLPDRAASLPAIATTADAHSTMEPPSPNRSGASTFSPTARSASLHILSSNGSAWSRTISTLRRVRTLALTAERDLANGVHQASTTARG